jgi:hypothetical protein
VDVTNTECRLYDSILLGFSSYEDPSNGGFLSEIVVVPEPFTGVTKADPLLVLG